VKNNRPKNDLPCEIFAQKSLRFALNEQFGENFPDSSKKVTTLNESRGPLRLMGFFKTRALISNLLQARHNSKKYPLPEKPLYGSILSVLPILSSCRNYGVDIQMKASRRLSERGDYGRFGALLDSRIASHA
jgi:hypothetical protein